MTACGPFDFETRHTDRGAEDSFSALADAKYEFSPAGIVRICADDVDEAAEQIRDWRVELTQLERGPAQVRGILVPLGNTLVGRGQCTRALCARGAAPADSVSFLFNASDVPGDFIVSLGCSDTPYAGSYIQKSLSRPLRIDLDV